MDAAGSDPGGAGRPVATGIQYAGAAEGGSKPGTGEECGRWRFAALAAAVPNHEWQPTNRTPAASQGVVRLHAAVVWIVAGGRGTGAASGVCQSSELAIRADFRATEGICGADCAGPRNVYEAIGRENVRFRRTHSTEYVRTRLIALDFILRHQGF